MSYSGGIKGNGITKWKKQQERLDQLNADVAAVFEAEHKSVFGYGFYTGHRNYHGRVIEFNNSKRDNESFAQIFGCPQKHYELRIIQLNKKVGWSKESKALDVFLESIAQR